MGECRSGEGIVDIYSLRRKGTPHMARVKDVVRRRKRAPISGHDLFEEDPRGRRLRVCRSASSKASRPAIPALFLLSHVPSRVRGERSGAAPAPTGFAPPPGSCTQSTEEKKRGGLAKRFAASWTRTEQEQHSRPALRLDLAPPAMLAAETPGYVGRRSLLRPPGRCVRRPVQSRPATSG